MFELWPYLLGAALLAGAGVCCWLLSLIKRDVSVVDVLWPLYFVIAGLAYAAAAPTTGPRAIPVIALVVIWALRLAGHIAARSRGQPEDRRYRAIRARNQPNFETKSLYLIFLFQAAVAWVVSLPLLGAVTGTASLNWLDALGFGLCVAGVVFEAVGDHQLGRFKANPANRGKVLDTGLWRYTRHPNYFGDFCVWWGFYLVAVGAGAWWSLPGPVLMTVFLLRVSGVALLESDIAERRPAYAEYVRRTNAFFPGPPKQSDSRTP